MLMARVNKFAAFSLATSLVLVGLPAFSATIAGTKCSKSGTTKIVANKKYTCVKTGKKLTWDKGKALEIKINPTPSATPTSSISPKPSPTPTPTESSNPSPTPTPSPTPSATTATIDYLPPSVPGSNVEICKIKETSNMRGRTMAGFPQLPVMAKNSGTAKWALIPIDFADLPGEPDPINRVKDQMTLLSEWFETVSEGKFKVEWVIYDKWITLPGVSSDYIIPFSDSPDRSPEISNFWKKAITSSDPFVDFTGISTVNFILPLAQTMVKETLQGFPWDQAVKNHRTNEGPISSFSIPGIFMTDPGRAYWSYWAHEYGHAITLPHIGVSRGEASLFHALDLMGSQDGPTRELSGWLRFLADWMPEERIYCQELSKLKTTEITLVPLSNSPSGLKMVVIPINESKTLIIESRRVTKFSCTTPANRSGVLAYVYDSKLGHNENFLTPLSPSSRILESSSCNTAPTSDLFIHQGEKITYEGVSVEVLVQSNFDRIRISLIPK